MASVERRGPRTLNGTSERGVDRPFAGDAGVLSKDVAFTLAAFVAALLPRLFVAIAWAKEPVWDGHYYHFGAERIARGLGYSEDVLSHGLLLWKPWVHYPVGYSAVLGFFYRIFGAELVVAPVVNAFTGALLVALVHRVARYYLSRDRARVAAGLCAMHPGLIAYSAVVMTEPLAALLLLGAALAALHFRGRWQAIAVRGRALGLGHSGATCELARCPASDFHAAQAALARRCARCSCERDRAGRRAALDDPQLPAFGRLRVGLDQWRLEPGHRRDHRDRSLSNPARSRRLSDRDRPSATRSLLGRGGARENRSRAAALARPGAAKAGPNLRSRVVRHRVPARSRSRLVARSSARRRTRAADDLSSPAAGAGGLGGGGLAASERPGAGGVLHAARARRARVGRRAVRGAERYATHFICWPFSPRCSRRFPSPVDPRRALRAATCSRSWP